MPSSTERLNPFPEPGRVVWLVSRNLVCSVAAVPRAELVSQFGADVNVLQSYRRSILGPEWPIAAVGPNHHCVTG